MKPQKILVLLAGFALFSGACSSSGGKLTMKTAPSEKLSSFKDVSVDVATGKPEWKMARTHLHDTTLAKIREANLYGRTLASVKDKHPPELSVRMKIVDVDPPFSFVTDSTTDKMKNLAGRAGIDSSNVVNVSPTSALATGNASRAVSTDPTAGFDASSAGMSAAAQASNSVKDGVMGMFSGQKDPEGHLVADVDLIEVKTGRTIASFTAEGHVSGNDIYKDGTARMVDQVSDQVAEFLKKNQ
jgi:hypothetical protein